MRGSAFSGEKEFIFLRNTASSMSYAICSGRIKLFPFSEREGTYCLTWPEIPLFFLMGASWLLILPPNPSLQSKQHLYSSFYPPGPLMNIYLKRDHVQISTCHLSFCRMVCPSRWLIQMLFSPESLLLGMKQKSPVLILFQIPCPEG